MMKTLLVVLSLFSVVVCQSQTIGVSDGGNAWYIIGTATDDLMRFNGSIWVRLAKGGNNTVLGVDGSGVFGYKADPSGGVSDGDKGDITVSGGGATWTIDAGVIPANPISVTTLASDAANNTTTGVEITGINKTVGVGTYKFEYVIRYQSSATTTGVKFGVNHTGTVSWVTVQMRYAGTGTSASTGAATQNVSGATGNVHESLARRAMTTTAPNLGPTVSVDAANNNMLAFIEGMISISASGDLELWHASETAANTTVKAGTALILTQLSASAL